MDIECYDVLITVIFVLILTAGSSKIKWENKIVTVSILNNYT